MKRKPYPAYKPSGVEWLGELPSHWEVKRLKRICNFAYGDSLSSEDREDGDFYVYGSNGVVGTHKNANTREPVIIVGRKGSYGKINFSRTSVFAIDTTYFIDDSHTKENLYWLSYMLRCLDLDIGSKDSAVPGLAREDAYKNCIPLPPLPEQQAIADFLDRETGKIDTLINKNQGLIELLKEKRMALISRAVTKGLDPTVKMKPSGVEWLDDMPRHWEVKKLKFLLLPDGYKAGPFGSSLITSELMNSGTIKVLSPEHIADDSFSIEYDLYLPEERELEMKQFFVKEHDVVFPIVGTLGRAKVITREVGKSIINQRLARVRVNKTKILPEYLCLLMSKVYFYQQLDQIESKGSILDHITKEKILNRIIFLPSVKEQEKILQYLDKEMGKIDALIAKVEKAIEKLKEYRTALISAAVTGKIDVREVA
ncbi:MAG TPA: restriction endonuclease subunit S [Syntrophorhabdaceae bacterium]|nr:restriction endonuclease subunit S [Syntrophorhabdaceae bacterium]HQM80767.1 restriction endonuclease subunit S [Syntrophorhabdaceae bacterium]